MSNTSYTSTILNQLYEGKKLLLIFATERDRENTRKALYEHKRTQDEILKVLLEEEKRILRFIKEPLLGLENEKVKATCWLEQPTVAFSFEVLDHHFSTAVSLPTASTESSPSTETEKKDETL